MNPRKFGETLGLLIPVFLSFFIAVWGGLSFNDIPSLFTSTFFRIFFLVIFVQILARTFKQANFDRELLAFIKTVSKDLRTALVLLPAIFGLLPMPAGAMLTATLSDTTGDMMGIGNNLKFFFNYWFRHIPEFAWPLYPGVIIAAGFAGISLYKFISTGLIFLGVALVVGLSMLFILISHKQYRVIHDEKIEENKLTVIVKALWPIVLLILLILIFKIDPLLSLPLTFGAFYIIKKLHFRHLKSIILTSILSRTTLLIFIILLFKGIVEKTHLLTYFLQLFEDSKNYYLPATILPFSVGFLTGVTQVAVGITFPILATLFLKKQALVFLAYVSGFMGVMVSPFHLCLATTKEYYGVSFKDIYKLVLLPVLILELTAILYVLLK